jgi:hypothetical protein
MRLSFYDYSGIRWTDDKTVMIKDKKLKQLKAEFFPSKGKTLRIKRGKKAFSEIQQMSKFLDNKQDEFWDTYGHEDESNRRPETEGNETPLVGINLIYCLIGALWVVCFLSGR